MKVLLLRGVDSQAILGIGSKLDIVNLEHESVCFCFVDPGCCEVLAVDVLFYYAVA